MSESMQKEQKNSRSVVIESRLSFPKQSGKVRDVYDLGDSLLIVSTDRISAFDWILPTGIPEKGIVLTKMSEFWFDQISVPHHLLTLDLPESVREHSTCAELFGRTMVVRKAQVVPFECVVRGYLEGSGWKEYQQHGSVCGISLPAGLKQCDRLPEPIFTPATKATEGHDENVTFDFMANSIGLEQASRLRELSLDVYREGCLTAEKHGILIADTKFEWGWHNDELILVDEVLTPDSSRFWAMDSYQPGRAQLSFDKQFVREWLMQTDWDRNSPPPELPDDVIAQTREKYIEVYERLSQSEFRAG